MLDFIPLAGAGRQVADDDVKAEFVGQLLEFAFPQPDPRAVAAPAIGGDQQSGCLGIARPTDGEPPLADTVHREGGRVMVDADTHPPGVRGQIIDPVGHRAAELLDQKVMDPDLFRVSLGAIFAPVVTEIPTGQARGLKAHDQFLLLGVDRDRRLLFGQSRGHLGVDMGELGIAVGMAVALRSLAVAVQTVTGLIEQVTHQGPADLVTLRLEHLLQTAHALAGPPQRRFGITPRCRLDQRLEIREQRGILGNRRFASGSRPPDPLRGLVPRQFLQTPPDRTRRNPGCHRDRCNPTVARGERLGRRDQTTAPLIEKGGHRRKPLSGGFDIDHYHNMVFKRGCKSISNITLSKVNFDNLRTGPKIFVPCELARIMREGWRM